MSGRGFMLFLNGATKCSCHDVLHRSLISNCSRSRYAYHTTRLLCREPHDGQGKLGRPLLDSTVGFKRSTKLKKRDWGAGEPKQNVNHHHHQQPRHHGHKNSYNDMNPSNRKIAPKRDWSRPVERQQPKNSGLERETEKSSLNRPKEKKRETVAEKRERRKREEEMAALQREEKKLLEMRKKKSKQKANEQDHMKDVYIPEIVSVSNLARILGIKMEQIIRTMEELELGNTSHDRMLNSEDASLIAMQLDMNPIVDSKQALDLYPRPPVTDPNLLKVRPPIVTIMGHVDHGKTTLLDTLRKSSVAAGEAGGITQHIGAFSVNLPSNKRITFLDTPGHAAFSAMRQRGASVTDIVVLVVAADDGVMPQTIEAIQHAHAANVPIVVAINKCDKPGVNTQKVKEELARYNVHLEEIGGDVPSVEVSGLTGKNLDQLEETIITLSEVLELRAEREATAEGVVIESQIEKGRGNVATLIVQRGTLKIGSVVVAGNTWCKVRSMTDHQGKTLKEALPGTPVKVIGWKDVPNAGDDMLTAKDENQAKTVVDNRIARQEREKQLRDLNLINNKRQQQREQLERERLAEQTYKKELLMYQQGLIETIPESIKKRRMALLRPSTPEEEGSDHGESDLIELKAVVKGDVSGTVEAVVDCLAGLQNKQIRVKVVQSGVGNITEGDLQLAAACDGQVIGFNVKADKQIKALANRLGVPVKSYSVIYRLLEEVKEQLSDMLPPVITTQVVGEAALLQVFDINVKGRESRPVAGCRVTNGSINKNNRVRIVRNKKTIWEGQLNALRQVKKDIAEAKKGLECGISFEGFNDFQPGDVIQSLTTVETKQKL